ncbi:Tfp pilus assembly protein FimT/FimU [Candidatus Margulisiibacteriota bacterium]
MNRKGFTYVEFVIILVVIAVLSVFAFVSLNPYKGVKLDAAAQKVKADLMYVRNQAMSLAKWTGVSFEVDPVNTYAAYQTDGTTDIIIENPSRLGTDFIIDLHDYYSGAKINAVNIAGGSKVEFHPLGTPYNDKSGAAISSEAVVTLEFQGLTKTVRITPNTGRVIVQ